MEAVRYLKRNDFTKICVESTKLITARDGKKVVYLILAPTALADLVVPQYTLSRARSVDARIDIIHVSDGELKHYINAVI